MEAISVLADALGLRHRRVQTEAAAALARLGNRTRQNGIDRVGQRASGEAQGFGLRG